MINMCYLLVISKNLVYKQWLYHSLLIIISTLQYFTCEKDVRTYTFVFIIFIKGSYTCITIQ